MVKYLLFFVAFFSQSCFAGIEAEPNNSSSQANIVAPGIAVSGQPSSESDQDWFKITSNAQGVMTVSFDPSADSGTCYPSNGKTISVYDSSGNLLSSKNGGCTTLSLQVSIQSGSYYLLVYPGTGNLGFSNTDYSLTLTGPTLGIVGGGNTTSTMTLRDAIYLYDKNINSYNRTELVGNNCDVFELVLDVESGYSDISMNEGSGYTQYPDRIRDYHKMFAYTLYKNSEWKSFVLNDKDEVQPDKNIASATAFAYCFSTNPDAYVLVWDQKSNTCTHSDGYVLTSCVK